MFQTTCHDQKIYIPENSHHFVHIVEKTRFWWTLSSKVNFCIIGQRVLTKIFAWNESSHFILQNSSFNFSISSVVPEIFQFSGLYTFKVFYSKKIYIKLWVKMAEKVKNVKFSKKNFFMNFKDMMPWISLDENTSLRNLLNNVSCSEDLYSE